MKTIFSNTLRTIALAAVSFAISGAAQATPITFDWTATATQANTVVKLGDKISGTITYDTTGATKGNSSDYQGSGYQYYLNMPLLKTTLTVGARTETLNLYAMIVNDFMWGGDEVIFRADRSPVGRFEFELVDNSKKALTSLALPATIDGSLFNTTYFSLGDYATQFRGQITQFGVSASSDVPEPASIALFGLALASLTVARRRGMR